MANDDNLVDDLNQSYDPDPSQEEDDPFYADDVEAEAYAETDKDEEVNIDDQDQVTSGDMNIGNLDDDPMLGQGGEDSYDEESVPAGDNVVD